MRPEMEAESRVKTWESCKKLGCELSNGSGSFETDSRKIHYFSMR